MEPSVSSTMLSARILSQRIRTETPLENNEYAHLRKNYEHTIETSNAKETLVELAKEMAKYLVDMGTLQECDIDLVIENQSVKTKGPIFTMGLHPSCEVSLPLLYGISRLHAVIMVFEKKILVIDVGCLHGIKTLARSNETSLCYDSTNEMRRVLCFDRDESILLCLGINFKVIINPRECVICLESHRDTKFNCGHFVCCKACSTKIALCPMCRSSIVSRTEIMHIRSNVAERH